MGRRNGEEGLYITERCIKWDGEERDQTLEVVYRCGTVLMNTSINTVVQY